jgi:peptidoglycan/LPS O-acetylase OafA/YrhL
MVSRTYYYGLDLLRFGSALIVASFHMFFWSWAGIFPTIDQTNHVFAEAANFQSATALTWFGWVGVEIFFVISGLVIANSADGASPMQFLVGRLLRLYPAAWICATGTLAALYLVARDPLSVLVGPYVRSLLLIPRPRWIDGVYWTLAVEISFYVLVFFILIFKRISLIDAAWVLTVFSSFFNALYLSATLGVTPLSVSMFLNFYLPVLVLLLLPHGCLFALGIWLWLAANQRMTAARWVGFASSLIASGAEVYAQGVQFLLAVPAAGARSPFIPVAIFFSATVMVIAFTRANHFFSMGSARGMKLLRYIGLVTYPFYLIHNLVGAGLSRLLIEAGLNRFLAVFLALSFLLSLCWLFCWGLEPVFKELLKFGLTYFERTILRPRRTLAFLFVKARSANTAISSR